MKEEVQCACEFISRLMQTKNLPIQFVKQFRKRLEELLSERFRDHWDPANPNKGSAYRCIRINNKMDPIIAEAYKVTGLTDIAKFLPAEFTMWIDPRDVSYRFGEDGSICSCPLDFMVTKSEWASTMSSTSSTTTVSTIESSSHVSRSPRVRGYHHQSSKLQASRSFAAHNNTNAPTSANGSYYVNSMYPGIQSSPGRLVPVQV